MIDMHSHILAGFDDGAKNKQEMLEMCRLARRDGITTVVATPHSLDGQFLNDPAEIRLAAAELTSALGEAGIDLRVLPGMELRIAVEIPRLLQEKKILALNDGKYVLIELHPSQIPIGLEHLLDELVRLGFGAILAHPEKNAAIQANLEYLFKLSSRFRAWDLLIQVTADSITGQHVRSSARTSKILLQHDLVHVISTDAHSSTVRPPRLSRAVEAVASIVGEERARQMVEQVPLAVLGEGAFPEEWAPSNPRRWWRLW